MAASSTSTEGAAMRLATAWAHIDVATRALNNANDILGKMDPSKLPVRTMKQRMKEVKDLSRQIRDVVDGKYNSDRGGEASLDKKSVLTDSNVTPPTGNEEKATGRNDNTNNTKPEDIAARIAAVAPSSFGSPALQRAIEDWFLNNPSQGRKIEELNPTLDDIRAAVAEVEMQDRAERGLGPDDTVSGEAESSE